jgi:hypothetical protein
LHLLLKTSINILNFFYEYKKKGRLKLSRGPFTYEKISFKDMRPD